MPKPSTIRSDLLLMLAAIIWGFAFVAQRMGMEHTGPFLFNAIRFALGAGVMVAVLKVREFWGSGEAESRGQGDKENGGQRPTSSDFPLPASSRKVPIGSGILLGLILFAGATFQQVGIVFTTAGNAGFITGLYVILVPVFGIYLGRKEGSSLWVGAVLASIGLYFLSVTENFTISMGDLLVLVGAIFWAVHVIYTGWLSPRHSALRLALVQYIICAALSFMAAFLFESNTFEGVYHAAIPLLYGGFLSVGVAFTLQIIGQKKAPPAHTAIILSFEAVFAVIGGVMILSETMTERKWIGSAFMLTGMLLAQLKIGSRQRAVKEATTK